MSVVAFSTKKNNRNFRKIFTKIYKKKYKNFVIFPQAIG